jgi:hypothetical protein
LSLKKRHSSLLVAHLESPNFSPRASIGAFSGPTAPIQVVLTGPNSILLIVQTVAGSMAHRDIITRWLPAYTLHACIAAHPAVPGQVLQVRMQSGTSVQ